MDANTQAVDDQRDPSTLSSIEAIRLMPGMYIGGTDQRALHNVVWCLIGHALQESAHGAAHQISVTLDPDNSVRISDDGLGLSIAPDPSTGQPWVERALTMYWAWGKASEYTTRASRRRPMFYPGLAVPVALAEQLSVEIKQQGAIWNIVYAKGECQTKLTRIRELVDPTETGTTITFQPDYSVFQAVDIDHDYMFRSLRELAFLMNEFTVIFEDNRLAAAHPSTVFHFPDGTVDFVRHLNRHAQVLHEPLSIRKTGIVALETGANAELEVDIAVQYTDAQQFMIVSYINGHETEAGGVHVKGFLKRWRQGLNTLHDPSRADRQGLFITKDEARHGMTAIISIWYPFPCFEGAIKKKLSGAKIKNVIEHLVWEGVKTLASDPQSTAWFDPILVKCLKDRAERINRRYGE